MLDNPAYASAPGAASDRRVHVRHRVQALAYLDIEEDNGGFVLDVSEEGISFQAVGPLERQTDVKLRIQVPKSQTRIETAGRVVWLGESNRVAGVRFLGMSSEARASIQEWILSETTPAPPLERSSKRQLTDPDKQAQDIHGDIIPASEQKRWLAVMGEIPQEPQSQKPVPNSVSDLADKAYRLPALQDLSTKTAPPAAAPGDLEDHAKNFSEVPEAPPTARHKLASTAGIPVSTNLFSVQPDEQTGNARDFPWARKEADNGEESAWPISTLRRVPAGVPAPSIRTELPGKSADLFGASVNLKAEQMRIVATIPSAPALVDKNVGRKWIAATAVFLALTICFAIWLGRQGSPGDSTPAPAVPAKQALFAGTSAASGAVGSNDLASASGGGASRAAGGASKNRKTVVAVSSAALQGSHQDVTLSLSLTPLTTHESERSTGPPPVIESMTPALQSAAAVPIPANATPTAPVARIVAGRTLGPTDRFNPCHLTYRVAPVYPAEAQGQLAEGTVKIHQVIGADGSVRTVTLISGSALLAPAALDAAQHWRYLPALLNGEPVETEQDIQIEFHLPR
jgi:TonB family protein